MAPDNPSPALPPTPAGAAADARVIATGGGDYAEGDIQKQGAFIQGGVVQGSVVGVNYGDVATGGTIIKDCAQVTVHVAHGSILGPAPRPAIERHAQAPRPPRPLRAFRDRQPEQSALLPELTPGHGAWLHGEGGCGLSTLLNRAANLPAEFLPDGVAYVTGEAEPASLDDIAQRLFRRFYATDVAVHLSPELARTYLGGLKGLFLLDRLPLSRADLEALADMLAGGTVLVAADGPAPETLLDLPLRGLPRADAVALCAGAARLDTSQPEAAAALERVCDALGDLPLPLLLAGRLIGSGAATLDQLLAALDGMAGERASLARAARLLLETLRQDERAVLAALARVGGPDADAQALAAASQLPPTAVEIVMARLIELGVAEGNAGRFALISASLRHTLDRLLGAGEERQRAAAFFAAAAPARQGDLAWLGRERPNLMAATWTSLSEGRPAQAGALALALQPLLVLRGMWGSWSGVTEWAVQAARASGDRALLAWGLHERGTRAGLLGDRAAAAENLARARELRLELGDQAGAAVTEQNMAYLGLTPAAPPRPARPLAAATARAALALLLIGAVILGGLAGYFHIAAVEVAIANRGCEPFAPPDLAIPFPGLRLPNAPIPPGGQAVATLPPVAVTVDATHAETIVVEGPLGLTIPIPVQGRLARVTLDGASILGRRQIVDLSDRPRHELVIVCGRTN